MTIYSNNFHFPKRESLVPSKTSVASLSLLHSAPSTRSTATEASVLVLKINLSSAQNLSLSSTAPEPHLAEHIPPPQLQISTHHKDRLNELPSSLLHWKRWGRRYSSQSPQFVSILLITIIIFIWDSCGHFSSPKFPNFLSQFHRHSCLGGLNPLHTPSSQWPPCSSYSSSTSSSSLIRIIVFSGQPYSQHRWLSVLSFGVHYMSCI